MSFSKHYFVEKELPDLILTVGIPGSGKSTWIKQFNKNDKYLVVNPDSIRKEITGSVSDESKNVDVWRRAKDDVVKAIDAGMDIILDATNINIKEREGFIEGLPPCNLKAKVFHADPEETKERIRKDLEAGTERNAVPPEAVDKYYAQFKDSVDNLDRQGFEIIE